MLLPVDEAEIRRDVAIKLEAEIRTNPMWADFRLNAAQVAIILSVPLFTLQPGGCLSPRDPAGRRVNGWNLHARLIQIGDLVKHFLTSRQGNEPSDNGLPEASSTSRNPSTPRKKSKQPSTPGKKSNKSSSLSGINSRKDSNKRDHLDAESAPARRNRDERKKCYDRDQETCVVMGTSEPHVCHIIPFCWNNSQRNIGKTAEVFAHSDAFFGVDWTKEYQMYLQNPQDPGGSDKAWNMICLDMQMHNWWAQARFGFKCLGVRPTTKDESVITLQFNWMPRSAMNPTDQITLQGQDNGFDGMVEGVKAFHQQGRSIPSPQEFGKTAARSSGAPILSGDLIDIKMLSSEAPLFKAMIDFQWAMIVVAALSGAPEPPKLPLNDDDFDPYFRTMKWVEEQSRQATPRDIQVSGSAPPP
ncbi:hypothetical protein N0V84_012543 [Fusarium piperis]|uniref:HNH nuclease domain-containing protein n=1 Tax=Fusarium piperis TaxID=1435070 RepID=A0A9W8TB98_9HYPO|nr:hypothetical protein N0V84_012543 [Fusarium piperis]